MRWSVLLALALAPSSIASTGCGDDDPGAQDASAADASSPDAPVPPPDAGPAPDAPPPPPGTACSTAIDLTAATTPVAGDTTTAGNGAAASCSGGSAFATDLYYRYEAGASPVDLIVDVLVDEGVVPAYDVVVSARTDCGAIESEAGCMDVGWGERLEVLGATGTVYLLVDGTDEFGGTPQGAFTISVATRAVAAMGTACDPAGVTSRCDTGLACEGGFCETTSAATVCAAAQDLSGDLADGAAEVGGTVHLFEDSFYAGGCASDQESVLPERLFVFTLAAAASLSASTDVPETTYDTVLYLRSACDGADLGCADDANASGGNFRSRLDLAGLAAGTYYLFVDASTFAYTGATAPGTPRDFRLVLTATPL